MKAELFKCLHGVGEEVVAKSLNEALEGQSTLKGLHEGVMIAL